MKCIFSKIMIRLEKHLIAVVASWSMYRLIQIQKQETTLNFSKNITLSWYSHLHATYKNHNFSGDSKT